MTIDNVILGTKSLGSLIPTTSIGKWQKVEMELPDNRNAAIIYLGTWHHYMTRFQPTDISGIIRLLLEMRKWTVLHPKEPPILYEDIEKWFEWYSTTKNLAESISEEIRGPSLIYTRSKLDERQRADFDERLSSR